MVIDVEDANGGSMRSLGMPILFNGTNSPSVDAAPQLGQHTQEVLQAWGVTPEEYALLLKEQACMQA
jgi:crotonobetainyl-CoA:carnitine CoA-transferase CaiB-like acyl-CoA transferase